MRIQVAAIALAAATTPLAANAHEADNPQATRTVIARGDLDLGQARDAQVMAARIHKAARRVCGGSPTFDPYHDVARDWTEKTFEGCYDAAVDAALAQLAAPLVSQAYADRHRSQRQ